MGLKKRLKLKLKWPKPAPKPEPKPEPDPVLSRLTELERRLGLQENEQRALINRLAWYAGKVEEAMTTMEDVKLKLVALEDVVKAAESAIDRLHEAVDYLRAHQGDFEGLTEVADKLDELKDELASKVATAGASGGV